MQLAGKVALVTGAGSGIGQAIATAFSREGARVALADVNRAGLDATAQALAAEGHASQPLVVDVTREAQVAAAVRACVAHHSRLDVLVNCAGIGLEKHFLDHDIADFRRVYEVNLFGVFLMCHAGARQMLGNGGGAIINIASVAGLRGLGLRAAYGSCKAAVVNLSRIMATDLAAHGIRVNAIAPGPVDTELVKDMHSEASRAAFTRLVPQHRYAAPGEVAGAAVFLASDAASFVTGTVLPVDGGFTGAGFVPD